MKHFGRETFIGHCDSDSLCIKAGMKIVVINWGMLEI